MGDFLAPYTSGPVAWYSIMPVATVHGVGRVVEVPGTPGPVTFEHASTGEQAQVDTNDLMPVEVALQRMGDYDWLPTARRDMEALNIVGAEEESSPGNEALFENEEE